MTLTNGGRRLAALALMLALALIAAACSGGGGEEGGGDAAEPPTEEGATEEGAEGEAAQGGEISVFITNPEHLAPASNITESEGAEVANAIYTPLVQWDLESSEAIFGDEVPDSVAADITTEDNQTFTITLKEGWTFHDGEPVTAQSYVDSWNYGAYGPNANTGAGFFANIQGYADLQCTDDNEADDDPCPTPPSTEQMSGLSVVDDATFEVTLEQPFTIFPLLLGYTAFNPMPPAFFDNPEEFENRPIGNGPFAVTEEGWVRDGQVRVERYEDYPGTQPNIDAVEYRIYQDVDSGYNDALAGNLDVMDNIPSAQIESARTEFEANFIDQESGIMQFLGFPTYDERFANPQLRQAISMAIDREAISTAVRPDYAPISGFVPGNVPGSLDDNCGGFCEYNPEEAQRLFEEAGGLDGTLTLFFNAGADHDAWIEAVANQLRQNLGIQDVQFETLQFAEYLPRLQDNQAPGPYRLGWVPDYPNPNTYLESLFVTDQSSNYTGWSNPEFDELVTQGQQAETVEASLEPFGQAQEILNENMPIAPMFVARQIGIASDRVSGFELSFQDDLNLFEVAVTE